GQPWVLLLAVWVRSSRAGQSPHAASAATPVSDLARSISSFSTVRPAMPRAPRKILATSVGPYFTVSFPRRQASFATRAAGNTVSATKPAIAAAHAATLVTPLGVTTRI